MRDIVLRKVVGFVHLMLGKRRSTKNLRTQLHSEVFNFFVGAVAHGGDIGQVNSCQVCIKEQFLC